MRLVLPALISVLSFVGTIQAASVPVQSKNHKIQLPGRFDKPADPGPFPAVILLHRCIGYQEHPAHSNVVEHASSRPRGGYSCDGVPSTARALDCLQPLTFFAKRPDV